MSVLETKSEKLTSLRCYSCLFWFTVLQIDFSFDDADIMQEGTLAAVIGRRKLQGEESIIQEKVNYFICLQI